LPKDEAIQVEAVVVEPLAERHVPGAARQQDQVLAHISGKMRKNFIRI